MLYHNHMIGGGNIRLNKPGHEVIEFESVFPSHNDTSVVIEPKFETWQDIRNMFQLPRPLCCT